jgi:hypothetical protein
MKNKSSKLSLVFMMVIGLNGLHAQMANNAIAENKISNETSLNYSALLDYATIVSDTNISESTVAQPAYQILDVTGITDSKGLNINLFSDSNSTNDNLILKVDNLTQGNFYYQINDFDGQFIECKKLGKSETAINLGNLVATTYLLKVMDNIKSIKIFKIIKS